MIYLQLIKKMMRNLKFKQNAQSVLIFSRWGRKSFSSFLTMHKHVVISVLSVIYFLSTPITSFATMQNDSTEVKMEYDLDEIEVSAQRTPVVYSQAARVISVIEKKEIEAAAPQSIQDLLEYIAGVDVRQRGADGVQADISIRGGTFDQNLILLNGVNISDPQTGHFNLDLPINLSQVERIEVLEGPAARVFGPNAFSGAINIVTKQSKNSSINANVSGGSFGYFNGNLSGSLKTGKMNHTISLGGKRSDGYIDNTDFKQLNGYYSNQLNLETGILKFQAGLSKKGFGANSFYSPAYPNQYEATKTFFTSLRWNSSGKFHFTPVVYYRRHQDRFELYRSNPASWYTSHNYHMTDVYGANANSWIKSQFGKTALGIEFRSENILSNTLGNDLDEPKDVPGEDAQFTKSDDRYYISGFLEHTAFINNWILSAGLLGNYISSGDVGFHVFPGIDISYQLNNALKLFASYNTSLRMPTFTDLYYDGPTNQGNPDLKPEKSSTIEGGLKANSKLTSGQIVLFYRQGKDIIDWVKSDDDEEIWTPENLTEVNNFGTEIQAKFHLKEQINKHIPDIQINYLYNHLQKVEGDFISYYILDNLKHKLTAVFDEQICKNVSFNLSIVYQDRNGTFSKYEDAVAIGQVSYEPFWLFDGKLSYQQKRFAFYVSANNIFDKTYNDIGNVIQPGRWLKTGIKYNINFKK
jgi:iron complex outermembrane receptor protein